MSTVRDGPVVPVGQSSTNLLPPARVLDRADEILAARRLQAFEYLRAGYLSPESLAADGTVAANVDPWVPFARHFAAFGDDDRVQATCRIIGTAPWPLPALTLPGIDPIVRRTLQQLPAGRLGEVSALATRRGAGMRCTRAVFRAVWTDSIERGVTDWVLTVDALVLRVLKGMDSRPYRVIGPPSPAPVRPVRPVWVRVGDMQDWMFTRGLSPEVVVLP